MSYEENTINSLAMDKDHQYSELRNKLIFGTRLAFYRLVEKAQLTDDYLVFSENGKVVKVKARSIDLDAIDPYKKKQ